MKKYLYSIKWTQPYNQPNQYLQDLYKLYEELVEHRLEQGHFPDANRELERIMRL
jgi:spore coat protein CotF